MAMLREVRVDVNLDTTRVQETLQIIAKHAQACADELAALDAVENAAEVDAAMRRHPAGKRKAP